MDPDVPEGVDPHRPSVARVYDYLLGGHHNFAIDRLEGQNLLAIAPGAAEGAATNRRFLARVVRFLIDQGIRQFLDLGSGIPTMGNVHDVAHAVAPDTRIVYVDRDPIAVRHSRYLLKGDPRVGVVEADVTDPERVLAAPTVRGLLDFSQPVAVLLVAVLPFVVDDGVATRTVAAYRDALVSDSFIAMAHLTLEDPEYGAQVDDFVRSYQAANLRPRSRAEVQALLSGLDLVEPGVVMTYDWRPDADTVRTSTAAGAYAAVGRKP